MMLLSRHTSEQTEDSQVTDPTSARQEASGLPAGDQCEMPKRRCKKACPVCGHSVVHLPRHLQGRHRWSKEKALSSMHRLRKSIVRRSQSQGKPKYKDYHVHRTCPVKTCGAVVKRLPPHLRDVHDISNKSPLFGKYLKLAKRQALELDTIFDDEHCESREDSSSVSQFSCHLSQHSEPGQDNAHFSGDPSDFSHLESFERWLTSPDGGMAATKSAKQHAAQVKAVLGSNDIPVLWDKCHVQQFIDDSVQKKKFQAGTVKAYLASLRHMYHYLLTENFSTSAESKQRIQTMIECVTRWIKAYRKESSRRGLEKMDSDFSKLITPQQIAEFEKSNIAVEAIKLIGLGMEDRLSQIMQSDYVSVRDFVITEMALNNASRSGAIANMTMAEYTCAKIVSNQHVVSVAQHKTAHCYGPAKICLSAMHFAWLKCYVSVFRPVVCHEDSNNVFLTWNGESMSSGQVSRAVQSAWSKAGIGNDITCTLIRKTAVSAIHQKMPQLKTGLADLMCHRVDTAAKSYRLVQREVTAADASVHLSGVLRDGISESSAVVSDSTESPCLPPGQQHSAVNSDHVSPSILSRKEQAIFSEDDVVFLSTVFKNTIRSGPMSQDNIRNTLEKSTTGSSLLQKFSIHQIISRLKYERRKMVLSVGRSTCKPML